MCTSACQARMYRDARNRLSGAVHLGVRHEVLVS